MQSNQSRVLVALGSVAAIVVLLVVFAGGDDDESTVAATTTTTPEAEAVPAEDEATQSEEKQEKPEKVQPEFERIVVVGGEPKGGVADLGYKKGDVIRLEVDSDTDEEVHVHGYDLFEDVAAGGQARFKFDADIEGVFEVELEISGVQLAQLTVNP